MGAYLLLGSVATLIGAAVGTLVGLGAAALGVGETGTLLIAMGAAAMTSFVTAEYLAAEYFK